MIDNPRDLTWRGRSNLYGNIGVYMAFSGEDERQEPIVDFRAGRKPRRSCARPAPMVATTSVWDAADPSQALATETDNPTRVFLLNPSIAAKMRHRRASRPVRVGPQEREDRRARSRPDDDDDVLPASPRVPRTSHRAADRGRTRRAGRHDEEPRAGSDAGCGRGRPSRLPRRRRTTR